MKTKTLVVVCFPDENKLLASDVAGKPACDHLLGNLSSVDEIDIRFVAGDHAWLRALCGEYPVIAGRGLSELEPADQQNRGLLIFDARAWFSQAALENLLSHTRGIADCLRVVNSRKNDRHGHRETTTLAAYLPVGYARSGWLDLIHAGLHSGLEELMDPEALAGGSVVEGSDLDASGPPLMLDSYEAIAELERRVLSGRALAAMRRGVRIRDPGRTYIRGELVCGSDVEIEVNVIIDGDVVLGNGVRIGANSIVRSSRIGDRTCIHPFTLVEHSSIGADGFVGPYGRIRPGSTIGDRVQIGNYVEIKNSQVGAGSRINHHAFIGDSLIADQVTIGAGAITCNHDGVGTNQTIIERGAYIGSGCNLVAPLRIGEGAIVGAGSTITSDVPAAKLTLARSPQTTVGSWRGPKTRRDGK